MDTIEYTHNVNTPVLRKYLEHITAHPEEWKQNSWAHDWDIFRTTYEALIAPHLRNGEFAERCGTAYCLAGHVVVGEGYDVVFGLDCVEWGAFETSNGRMIPSLAAEILGIHYNALKPSVDENGNDHLFLGGNSLLDLWTIASRLTQGEIEVPPHLSDGV